MDPTRHFFDSASAPQVVWSLGPARSVPSRPDIHFGDPAMHAWSWGEGQPWADAMSHALAEHYGRWTVGWRWSHDEGDFDGGPVANWCCPRDSITTPQETLARVVAALREWREWLESLAGWFDAYPLDLADIDDQRILWERAARNLLQVTDRTGCGSGWHGHCRQVLTWFLNRWGVAPGLAQELLEGVSSVLEEKAVSVWRIRGVEALGAEAHVPEPHLIQVQFGEGPLSTAQLMLKSLLGPVYGRSLRHSVLRGLDGICGLAVIFSADHTR